MFEQLLEDLAKNRSCFISSLKDKDMAEDIIRVLLQMDLESYGVRQCNYCISYLSGQKIQFHSVSEVRAFLQDRISHSGEE